MIEKKEHYNHLLDVYGCLLTNHQVEICRFYYEDDLSLQEIAENYKISRNAVFDNIKRVETLLDDYESKLKLVEKETKEMNKQLLVTIKVPLSEKEKINNLLPKCEIYQSNKEVFVSFLTEEASKDEVIKLLMNNINKYEIKILKIEKEIKK